MARRAGSGAPVVLVHPSSGGLDSFQPITPLLDGAFELWMYARRGYAPSGGRFQPKTFADDVADLEAVLATAGGHAHVVGASYGATVALHTALAGGHGIRSLVLFEPPLFAAGPPLGPVLDRYRACLDEGAFAAAARLFAAEVAQVPSAILDALADSDDGVDPAEAIGCLHDLEAMAADTSDTGRWVDVTVPVLLMQGADTWAPMPQTMRVLAATLPSVTRAVLDGQSHFATHTAPTLFADTVREFLTRH
jgi:pimeloyl-ACP methyl ester carboxylesterase